VLKFSPESFKDPIIYLDQKETAESVIAMKDYLTFKTSTNPGFLVSNPKKAPGNSFGTAQIGANQEGY
jgi:hypothetical protein